MLYCLETQNQRLGEVRPKAVSENFTKHLKRSAESEAALKVASKAMPTEPMSHRVVTFRLLPLGLIGP